MTKRRRSVYILRGVGRYRRRLQWISHTKLWYSSNSSGKITSADRGVVTGMQKQRRAEVDERAIDGRVYRTRRAKQRQVSSSAHRRGEANI